MSQGKQQPQHQPADGPAFWNIKTDFKPGELESGLSTMFFNQAIDLQKENEALKACIKRLEEAGDNMAEWLEDMRNLGADACLSYAWREAKEAKL